MAMRANAHAAASWLGLGLGSGLGLGLRLGLGLGLGLLNPNANPNPDLRGLVVREHEGERRLEAALLHHLAAHALRVGEGEEHLGLGLG